MRALLVLYAFLAVALAKALPSRMDRNAIRFDHIRSKALLYRTPFKPSSEPDSSTDKSTTSTTSGGSEEVPAPDTMAYVMLDKIPEEIADDDFLLIPPRPKVWEREGEGVEVELDLGDGEVDGILIPPRPKTWERQVTVVEEGETDGILIPPRPKTWERQVTDLDLGDDEVDGILIPPRPKVWDRADAA